MNSYRVARGSGFSWLCLLLVSILTGLAACGDGSPPAPVISVQPIDTAAVVGSTAHFGLTANGAGLTYQWQRSGDGGASWADIAGATQAGYTTPATTLADDGTRYRATVAAAGITLTSSAVRLTVTAATVAPAFSIQPTAQTVIAPAAATFSVTATGTALAYQWQRSLDGGISWLALSSAADPSYGTGDTDPTMDGQQFRVVISNAAGSVTSSAARLTVSAAPIAVAITTQPLDQSVSVGAAAAFSVAATGTPAPSLQWQRSLDGGVTWADIASATAPTFNTGPTALSQSGERYRAVASNGAGTATSDPARLTVIAGPVQPVFTVEPADSTVVAPASATFSVRCQRRALADVAMAAVDRQRLQLEQHQRRHPRQLHHACDQPGRQRQALPCRRQQRHRKRLQRRCGAQCPGSGAGGDHDHVAAGEGHHECPVQHVVAGIGGTPPYSWRLTGALPAGLSLGAATGQIAGTPTGVEATYAVAIEVSDSSAPAQTSQSTLDLLVEVPATPLGTDRSSSPAHRPRSRAGFCPTQRTLRRARRMRRDTCPRRGCTPSTMAVVPTTRPCR